MNDRACPHPHCREIIPSEMFACRVHWRRLPREIKSEINSAWREILSPGGIERHEAAGLTAVEYWEHHRR